MPTYILGGTNFHRENYVSSCMARGTISISDSYTVFTTSPALLAMDKLDSRHGQAAMSQQVSVEEYEILSPSKNKLELITHCNLPGTVKGLLGFLGEIRLYETYLPDH